MRPAITREHRSQPRHRLEKSQKNRHFLLPGSIAAASTAVVISVGIATGGGAVGATPPSASPMASTMAFPSAIPLAFPSESASAAKPEPIVRSNIIASDGASAGPVTGGTVVTATGADLGNVASVRFGGNAGEVVSATDDTVTLTTPPSTDFNTGTVAVELFDIGGQAVDVAASASSAADVPETADSAVADTGAVDPAATPSESGNSSAASATVTPLTFSYVPDPQITAQIDYVLAHWQNYNSGAYGAFASTDCVNFASQSLIARGWTMDAEWWFNPAAIEYSPAWISSTAFAAYLAAHPERATALTDAQRDQVKVGDIIQFDWDLTGDRDHTGIVSRVDKTAAGVQIYYAAHTADADYKSVDESLVNTGGTVSYWSVK